MRQPFTDDGQPYNWDAWLELTKKPGQTKAFKAELLLDGRPISTPLETVITGTTTSDRRRAHQGSFRMEVYEPTMIPTALGGGLISPSGYEVQIWSGLYDDAGRRVLCSQGIYGIETVEVDGGTGVITMSGWDRSRRIADAKLLTPIPWVYGGLLSVYYADLVFRSLPFVARDAIYSLEGSDSQTQAVTHTIDADPWKIITDSAMEHGVEAFFDSIGWFKKRPEPDLRHASPIATYAEVPIGADGEPVAGAVGLLTKLDVEYSREPSHNRWRNMNDSAADLAEISAEAIDNDPSSLTYIGTFGSKPAPTVRSKTILHVNDARAAAEARKAANLGIARTLTFSGITNAGLEAADAMTLARQLININETLLIDEVTVGLGAKDPMTGRVRAKQDFSE